MHLRSRECGLCSSTVVRVRSSSSEQVATVQMPLSCEFQPPPSSLTALAQPPLWRRMELNVVATEWRCVVIAQLCS